MHLLEFNPWDRAYWEFGKGNNSEIIKLAEIIIAVSKVKNLITLVHTLGQT